MRSEGVKVSVKKTRVLGRIGHARVLRFPDFYAWAPRKQKKKQNKDPLVFKTNIESRESEIFGSFCVIRLGSLRTELLKFSQ